MKRSVFLVAVFCGIVFAEGYRQVPIVRSPSTSIEWRGQPPGRFPARKPLAGRGSSVATLTSLPVEAESSVSRAIGRDIAGYQAHAVTDGLLMANPRHNLTEGFNSRRVVLHVGETSWKMALVSYGYEGFMRRVERVVPEATANVVEYRRGTLTEWYANGPAGLEQGFTINERPNGLAVRVAMSGNQPLTLALAVSGDLVPTVDSDRTGLVLTGQDGHTALHYRGLVAWDAEGKFLRAGMALQGDRLLLKVEDAKALYPVTVDPWVQFLKLAAPDAAAGDNFGDSVAMSGNTIVVGASCAGGIPCYGAAFVFTTPDGNWTNLTQIATLKASDGASQFGRQVAVSGNTVVVGSPYSTVGSDQNQGAEFVFVEPSTGWTDMTETAELTASDGKAGDELGASVSISGNTVVAGAPGTWCESCNPGPGAAYVFVEPGGGWVNATETAKLTASDGANYTYFGYAVGISGNTVIAGAPGGVYPNTVLGKVYAFMEPPTGWTDMTETAKLTASDGGPNDYFGAWVAVSGNEAVASGPSGAYVFAEPVGGWASMSETAKLTAPGAPSGSGPVSIDGKTVVMGTYNNSQDGGSGIANVFTEPASGWASMTPTTQLPASDGAKNQNFSTSVAVSGSTVVVGSPQQQNRGDIAPGAAYVFTAGSTSGPGFALSSVGSATVSANPGEAANFTFAVVPVDGFNGTVSFTCTGAPSESTCQVSPQWTLDGVNLAVLFATVTTTASSSAYPARRILPRGVLPLVPPGFTLLLVLIALATITSRCRRVWARRALAFVLVVLWASCGGGGGNGGGGGASKPGTPAGTYTITITGTSGSLTNSVTLTLKVS